MNAFLQAARLLATDLASSLIFVVVYSLTHQVVPAAVVAILFGIAQIVVQYLRKKPIDTMEWLSLFLVLASGTATVLTDNAHFVLFKPSAIYLILGVVMMKRGWMNRYLPAIVRTVSPDVATAVGYAWAGLMFLSALVNAVLASQLDVTTWALSMTVFGIASKAVLFVAGFAAMRIVTRRRVRAMPVEERDAVLRETGWTAGGEKTVQTA